MKPYKEWQIKKIIDKKVFGISFIGWKQGEIGLSYMWCSRQVVHTLGETVGWDSLIVHSIMSHNLTNDAH